MEITFFSWFHVKNHYFVKFGVHRLFRIGDITFFIFHEAIYNHLIKISCDFVHGDPIT